MYAGAHRAFGAWRTAGNDFGKDKRVEPKRRRYARRVALYCGLSNNPHKRWNSKQFFAVIQNGKGSVPLNIEGRNFIESLADILRNGPEAMGVESVFISYVISASDSHSSKAHIHFENGKTESFATGQVFPMTHTEGVLLSYSQLRALHEDLIATKRTWPQDEQLPLTHLQFDAGKIHII